MRIGNLNLANKYILAPMAGVTDLPFRLLCKEQGCSLLYTEMISAKGLYYKDEKTKSLMETVKEERPIGIQIFGSDPKIMSQVTRDYIGEDHFDIVDINAGCPTPKIVKNGDGSALMKNPQLIGEIIYSISRATHIPVTLKIRAGWDDNSINAVEIAKIAQEAGAKAITVHGRTREQFYSGSSNWDIVKEVKQNVSIPVIGNGDVKTSKDAIRLLDSTKCDGIMIGRASFGNPWIFYNLINKVDQVKDVDIKINTAIRHLDLMLTTRPERVAIGEIRKHIAWYTKGLKGSSELRDRINHTGSREDIKDILLNFLTIYN